MILTSYELIVERSCPGDRYRAWQIWSDPPSFPKWDPRELETRLDGDFQMGVTGWSKQKGVPGGPFKIIDIDEKKYSWTAYSELPGGCLTISHEIQRSGPYSNEILLRKCYVVTGWFALPFRLIWGWRIRKDTPLTLERLAELSGMYPGNESFASWISARTTSCP